MPTGHASTGKEWRPRLAGTPPGFAAPAGHLQQPYAVRPAPLAPARAPDLAWAADAVMLDTYSIHEGVNADRFDAERVLELVPPDGQFALMNYRCSRRLQRHRQPGAVAWHPRDLRRVPVSRAVPKPSPGLAQVIVPPSHRHDPDHPTHQPLPHTLAACPQVQPLLPPALPRLSAGGGRHVHGGQGGWGGRGRGWRVAAPGTRCCAHAAATACRGRVWLGGARFQAIRRPASLPCALRCCAALAASTLDISHRFRRPPCGRKSLMLPRLSKRLHAPACHPV